MESVNAQNLDVLLERAGLDPTQQDRERLRPLFEAYIARLNVLHAADLDDEEVAGVFPPQESLSQEGAP